MLEDGERLAMEAGGFSYRFEFGEEANIFEGAKVVLVIGGRVVAGYRRKAKTLRSTERKAARRS